MIYKQTLGHKISMLGMGAMRLPPVNPDEPRGAIDRENAIKLIRDAYESGVNYFDTAYVYGGGESERILGEALSIYPRDTYYVATKFPGLHPPVGGWTKEKVAATFAEQLEKLGMDYIDFYLLHGIMESDYDIYTDPSLELPEYFVEMKKQGKIRHFGFSSHSTPPTLKKILDWKDCFEFVQIQLNYLDWTLQHAKEQYEMIAERGLAMIIMEPCRGGKLAHLSDGLESEMRAMRPNDSIAAWAFRYLKTLPNVNIVLSGMTYPDQLADNLKTFSDDEALTDEQVKFLYDKVVPSLAEMVPCTACRYCCEGCPKHLDIPVLISIYNEIKMDGRSFRVGGLKPEELPSNCVGCGKCMKVCPQAINIPEIMKDMAARIDAMRQGR